MKKISALVLSLTLLAGCSSGSAASSSSASSSTAAASTAAASESALTDLSGVSFLAPSGAPAISLIPVYQLSGDVTIVDGPDLLQSELVSGSSSYNVILAPTNLGLKLASAGKTDYRMLAVVSWGNLYLVGTSEEMLTSEDARVAAFGEQAVAGILFQQLYPDLADRATWYDSVSEASAALIAGEADIALLAEPAATAAISKAAQNGTELSILASLEETYGEGIPQSGMFVRTSDYEADPELYNAIVDLMASYASSVDTEDPSQLVADIDAIGAEQLGVASSAIIGQVYDRLNIHVVWASDHEEEIADFMKLFGLDTFDSSLLIS